MKYCLTIIYLTLSASLYAQAPLEGTWLRVQDETASDEEIFASNRIEIFQKDGKWVGVYIEVSEGARDYGYQIGQIKWKNIRKAGKKGFKCQLLLTDPDDFENPKLYKRLKAKMILEEKQGILFIRFDEWAGDGDRQKFIRVEDNPS